MAVFELLELGPVVQVPNENSMEEEQARIHFRDLLLGVEYRMKMLLPLFGGGVWFYFLIWTIFNSSAS